jgi:hypothetical protein
MAIRRVFVLLAITVSVASVPFFAGGGLHAQTSPIEKAATAGRIKIVRAPSAAPAGPPDLLFFPAGRIEEAWDLAISGATVSFRKRGADGGYVDESVPKSELRSILIGRTLESYLAEAARTAAPEPVEVTEAEKQPAPRAEILAGRFAAMQGRYTRWTFSFMSEINKYYADAENATEYGVFFLRSHQRRPVGETGVQENEVIARGKYFLYAPGTMSNDEWVLNLSSVVYIENDISPRKTFFSDRLPDEVFIVKLSRDGRVMDLKWANHAGWQWSAPVEQTYYRIGDPPASLGGAAQRADRRVVSLLPPKLREEPAAGRELGR